MKYNFLYTANSDYFNHMYLSIFSLLKNNNYPLTIHIIESEFTIEQREKLERLFNLCDNATLKVYSINKLKDIMDKYAVPKWRGTDIANARLFSSEVVDVDRVLYIDCDTIISSSLKDVFDTNIDNPVSAVREMNVPEHIEDRLNCYYNAGILLIDYRLCAEIDFLKLIFDILDDSIILRYPDQDLLNLAIGERMGILKPNYNINPMTYDMIKKHPILTKKYLQERESIFYKIDELNRSYNDPKIYHLLEYVHTRPWIKNHVHPFNSLYGQLTKEVYGEFVKGEPKNNVDMIIGSMSLFSAISILLEVMPFGRELDVKDKIRKIIYFNRK